MWYKLNSRNRLKRDVKGAKDFFHQLQRDLLDYFSDPTNFGDVDYTDPRAMAEWAKRMGEAAGVDMGDDYEEMVEQIASGDEDGGFAGEGLGSGGEFGLGGDLGDL